MKLTACITINARPLETLDAVFLSMRSQAHDEFIIVLDRVPEPVSEYCHNYWAGDPRTKFVDVRGAPGWRSPVKAWNRGYAAVTGDLLYCFSSETTQNEGNVAKAKAMLENEPAVIFGKVECTCGPNGSEVNWGGTAPGNLLCDAAHPRPLGFIWAAPMKNVRHIRYWDEKFDDGYWYDEADFFMRLWRSGLGFTFDDSISGAHIHHERPVLGTPEGQEGIRQNTAYMLAKYGILDPLRNTPRLEHHCPGHTTWRHI